MGEHVPQYPMASDVCVYVWSKITNNNTFYTLQSLLFFVICGRTERFS